ncbi:MAG: fibronectin type III domain-containing protein, partial [Solirubrobacteraceae bacterium]
MRMMLLAILAALPALPAAAGAQIIDPTPPSTTTGAAKAVARTTATVTGTVDPNGSATGYHFEYGTTTAYGLQTPDEDAGEGDGDVAAEAPLAGLTPATTYHYRLVATNGNGT